MQPLYTETEFKEAKYADRLPIRCKFCNRTFLRTKRRIVIITKHSERSTGDFCSSRCSNQHNSGNPPRQVICDQCGKPFQKRANEIKTTNHNFCCQSCSALYTNAHKTKGTCVSKLERWLQVKLHKLYPALEFHFNRKDAIKSELDIFIPPLRLAFELNGIFHYEPIFGQDKLDSIQNNDRRKFAACHEAEIELCIIDVSSMRYFKERRAKRFLEIIRDIIGARIT